MKPKLYFLSIALIFLLACSDKAWDETQAEGTIEAYQNYIKNNPEAEFVTKAQFCIDSMLYINDTTDWGIATRGDTIINYEKYISEYPEGKFLQEAKDFIKNYNEKIEKAKNEINVWNNAKQENTVEAYKNYLDIYYRATYKYEAYRNIYYLENSEFVEKYKRVFELFDKVYLEEDFNFNEFAKYFSKDTCFFNGNIGYPRKVGQLSDTFKSV